MPSKSSDSVSKTRVISCAIAVGLLLAASVGIGVENSGSRIAVSSGRSETDRSAESVSVRTVFGWGPALVGFFVGAPIGAAIGFLWGRQGVSGIMGFLFVTLVGEGLTLPWVVRKLGLANAGRRERQAEREEEFKVRRRAIEAAIERLETIVESRKLPEPVAGPIRAHQRNRLLDVEYRKDGNDHRRKLAELSDDDLEAMGCRRMRPSVRRPPGSRDNG